MEGVAQRHVYHSGAEPACFDDGAFNACELQRERKAGGRGGRVNDKVGVARPLRDALTRMGITVWLDETQMRLGHSLRRKIDEGIRSSRFGVVILSEAYFQKGWTNHELDGLVTRTVAGEQSLLPIWHGLSADEVRAHSPSLADKVAMSTRSFTIEEIAEQIAEVVTHPG